MKNTLKALTVLTLALSPITVAHATNNPYLGSNVTRTYDLADLMNKPGQLDIGKQDMFILDMPETVTEVVASKEGLLQVEVMDNLVMLTAKKTTGSTPLMIRLESGKYAMWQVRAVPGGNTLKRIQVLDHPNTDVTKPNLGSLPISPVQNTTVITTSPTVDTTPQNGPELASARQNLNAAISSVQSLKTQSAPVKDAPAELHVKAVKQNAEKSTALVLTLSNGLGRDVTLDAKYLKVRVNGQTLDAQATTLSLTAGSTSFALVTLPQAVQADAVVTVEWLAYDSVTKVYYRLSARVA